MGLCELTRRNSLVNSGEELLKNANYGEDIIVGVMDSGVWPESSSFNDEGMGPVPKSWNGICQEGVAFNASHCNRKLIGARYYFKGYEAEAGPLNETRDFRSPRDVDGHGPHTASTGTATGGAPNVRLAIYKICWTAPDQSLAEGVTCLPDDTLAAFDDAIADGVHVLSISLAFQSETKYYTGDPIAIGSLHAVKRNIVVACGSGNDGPTPSTVANVAPWIITVGASNINRVFSSPILLGNGMIVEGQTVTPIRRRRLHPLVYARYVEIRGTTASNTTGTCLPGTLSRKLVRGKVVICINSDIQASMEVKRAGGVAAILGISFNEIQVIPFLNPATVTFLDGLNTLLTYILTEKHPTLDITAPGFNILAAWSEASSPLKMPEDRRVVKYNIVSGTSMSCPHVSATINNAVGRPIKNAIGDYANPFEYGSGHFRPSRAADPGLIYNATYTDYLLYLCSQNIRQVSSYNCPDKVRAASNLNYPSLAIANMRGSSRTVTRVVTNVGKDNSTYILAVSSPPGYIVDIVPKILRFSKLGKKHNFNITVTAQSSIESRNEFSFGWYTWSDGVHMVRSPIAVSSSA
ncbi:hypothetical protein R3W88_005436 [Solanum pinnatisectum]|uniref:Subtilisin-like protease n=1 Tax=Solanum pinnatisectum TaxID=50273 RepID=A0AAV9KDG1_9SOLN|nr:hypothetical protein R3W88_005436 [Solanum pinnatisectum]